ncbi:unnamed protein product [Rhizophagus irregularis]|nr:unnamed protein product [Rhizophagus irregularis]
MNNKKSKIETFNSVSDVVKHKKSKIETSTSVSDLVKPRKSKIETSASMSDLIKSKKLKLKSLPLGFNPFNEDTDSFQPNNNENIHTLFSSSPLLPNPSYFHVPAPDENKLYIIF